MSDSANLIFEEGGTMNRINRLLTTSAEIWHVSPLVARVVFWTPLVISPLIALSRLRKPIYNFMLHEDGPAESATFWFFALAVIVGMGVMWIRLRSGHRWQALLFLVFAVAMFFCAGEEIAWGQHILHFGTPEKLAEVNKQDEFTLHNIGNTLRVLNVIILLVGGAGAAAYLVNQRLHVERYLADVDFLVVPPFFLASWFFVASAYRLFRLVVWRKSGFTITKYAEWTELCFAFGLFAFSWFVFRHFAPDRERASSAQVQTPPA
jgi:hypothetical protein